MKVITNDSRELFAKFASDVENWAGKPMTSGTKEQHLLVLELVAAGLIETHYKDGAEFVVFTPLGRQYAREIGVEVLA